MKISVVMLWACVLVMSPSITFSSSRANMAGEVMIAIDVSVAQNEQTFERVLDFGVDLVNALSNFIQGNRGIRIGLVTFAYKQDVYGLFPEYTARQIIARILESEQKDSTSLIHDAIDAAVSAIQKDGRQGATRVIVVVTHVGDVIHSKMIQHSIRMAKRASTHIVGVGIGDKANIRLMTSVSTRNDAFSNPVVPDVVETIVNIVSKNISEFTTNDRITDRKHVSSPRHGYVRIDDMGDMGDDTTDNVEVRVDSCERRKQYVLIALDASATLLPDEFTKEKAFIAQLTWTLKETADQKNSHISFDIISYSDKVQVHQLDTSDIGDIRSIGAILDTVKHERVAKPKNIRTAFDILRSRSDWITDDVNVVHIVCTDGDMPTPDIVEVMHATHALHTTRIHLLFVKIGFNNSNVLWKALKNRNVPTFAMNIDEVANNVKGALCSDEISSDIDSCILDYLDIVVLPFKTSAYHNPRSLTLSTIQHIRTVAVAANDHYNTITVNVVLLEPFRRFKTLLHKLSQKNLADIYSHFRVIHTKLSIISELKRLKYNSTKSVGRLYVILRKYPTYITGALTKISVAHLTAQDEKTFRVEPKGKKKVLTRVDAENIDDETVIISLFRREHKKDCTVTTTLPPRQGSCESSVHEIAIAIDLSSTLSSSQMSYLDSVVESVINSPNVTLVGLYVYNTPDNAINLRWELIWKDAWQEKYRKSDIVEMLRYVRKELAYKGSDIRFVVIHVNSKAVFSRSVGKEVDLLNNRGVSVIFLRDDPIVVDTWKYSRLMSLKLGYDIIGPIERKIQEFCIDDEVSSELRRDLKNDLVEIVIAIDTSETFLKSDLRLELSHFQRFLKGLHKRKLLKYIVATATFGDMTSLIPNRKYTFAHIRDSMFANRFTRGGKDYPALVEELRNIFDKNPSSHIKKIAVVFTDGMMPTSAVRSTMDSFDRLHNTGVDVILIETGYSSHAPLWGHIEKSDHFKGKAVSSALEHIKSLVLSNNRILDNVLNEKTRIAVISINDGDNVNEDRLCWFSDFNRSFTQVLNYGVSLRLFMLEPHPLEREPYIMANTSHDYTLGTSKSLFSYKRITSLHYVYDDLYTYFDADFSNSDIAAATRSNILAFFTTEVDFAAQKGTIMSMLHTMCSRVGTFIVGILVSDNRANRTCVDLDDAVHFGRHCQVYCYVMTEVTCNSRFALHATFDGVLKRRNSSMKCKVLIAFAIHSTTTANGTGRLRNFTTFLESRLHFEYDGCKYIAVLVYSPGNIHLLGHDFNITSNDDMSTLQTLINDEDLNVLLNSMERDVVRICDALLYVIFSDVETRGDVGAATVLKVHDLIHHKNGTLKGDVSVFIAGPVTKTMNDTFTGYERNVVLKQGKYEESFEDLEQYISNQYCSNVTEKHKRTTEDL